MERLTYKSAGVDVDAGNRAVELMKEHVKSTFQPGVLGNFGGFGGLFQLDVTKYQEPILVSGTDGVGTKLKIAFILDKHDTIGIDAVAMCINDILVHGADPLFFLDYIAVGKLIPEKIADIVKGVAEGCRIAGCALLGGETAEMPGMYNEDEYDIAGFAVGVADKSKIIDGSLIKNDDIVIGIASSGLHSNGYSMARKVFFELGKLSPNEYVEELGCSLGEEILKATKIYSKTVSSLKDYNIHGMAHITGGGFIENLPRILPQGLQILINQGTWEIPAVFNLIQNIGKVENEEMYRTFNMGIGYVLIVPEKEAEDILNTVLRQGEKAWIIGQVSKGSGGGVFCQR